MKYYQGCRRTDGAVEVPLYASKAASSRFTVTILPIQSPYHEHRAIADTDYSSNPVDVIFEPGDTVKSGFVKLLSNPRTAKLHFALQLSLPICNNVTVSINMEEMAFATIMC